MNEMQARTLREAHDSYVKTLNRERKPVLGALYRNEMAERGMFSLFGGPVSKDELISALVELRYPLAKLNESIHVLYHTDGIVNEVCEHCNRERIASPANQSGPYAYINDDQHMASE